MMSDDDSVPVGPFNIMALSWLGNVGPALNVDVSDLCVSASSLFVQAIAILHLATVLSILSFFFFVSHLDQGLLRGMSDGSQCVGTEKAVTFHPQIHPSRNCSLLASQRGCFGADLSLLLVPYYEMGV